MGVMGFVLMRELLINFAQGLSTGWLDSHLSRLLAPLFWVENDVWAGMKGTEKGDAKAGKPLCSAQHGSV